MNIAVKYIVFPKGYMPLAGDNDFILPYPNGLSFSDNSSCLAKFAEEYLIICFYDSLPNP